MVEGVNQSAGQWFSNVSVHPNHLENLFKHIWPGPSCSVSNAVGGRGPKNLHF